ncbi:MAG: nucleotidyltransferase domain-containing protein [Actinobacteria bacterium]|nr:nucleotidyltransferase domain-containing protein [Actinomycetota bacterium]
MRAENEHGIKKEKPIENLKRVLGPILAGYPVVSAYLFGSYAGGVVRPESDIDIAVNLRPGSRLPVNEELSLGRTIENLSGLKPVDLRVINDMALTVQGEILTKGILLYSADDKARVAFETRTLALYLDYLPHLERFREDFLESVKKQGIL